MDTVWVIQFNEENVFVTVPDMKVVVDNLIRDRILDGDTAITHEYGGELFPVSVENRYGDGWKDVVYKLNREQFNDLFFDLHIEEWFVRK